MADNIKFEDILKSCEESDQSELNRDFETVAEMLRRAREFGLEQEIVLAFGMQRARGRDVSDAAWHACAGWDI